MTAAANPSTALATVLVDELIRCGLTEAVLCPGSRSAPLAHALAAADRSGRLRLHVRVDERAAGFLALGLAKHARRPVAVVTTSGTAVANLHPAVLEARHALVPLVVLSADRPDELWDTGANQTTDQPGIFGQAVRFRHAVAAPASSALTHDAPAWRTVVDRAAAAALGLLGGDPGPVHLNVSFREPLVPLPGADPWPRSIDGRADGAPWTALPARATTGPTGPLVEPIPPGPRTLMVLGDLPTADLADQAVSAADRRGWPVIAEPFGRYRRDQVMATGTLAALARPWLAKHRPDRVIVVGRPTLSRHVGALLRTTDQVEVVTAGTTWADPGHRAHRVHPMTSLCSDAPQTSGSADSAWRAAWAAEDQRLRAAVTRAGALDGLGIMRTLAREIPDRSTVFVGSSNSARDVDAMGALLPDGIRVLASRGLAGIDGCVSTAIGLALAGDRPTYAVMGDLTFLHDSTGLLIGPGEPRPDLTIIVTDDGGGSIFAQLEYAAPELADDLARVFRAPTGADLAMLCAAAGVPCRRVAGLDELATALRDQVTGLRVIVVPVHRDAAASAHAGLRAAVLG